MDSTALGYAIIGGLLPSLVWLYFLLKEDANCPEPRAYIGLAFVAGMVAVPLALPLEFFAQANLAAGLPVLIAWATIEELLKYFMGGSFIAWRRVHDETPDYVVYMLTVALGFAAAENMLFLLAPLSAGNLLGGASTADLRFLGSTLIHALSSSAIGFSLAFSAHKKAPTRIVASSVGLILAVSLHTGFNALIIMGGGSSTLAAFSLVWTATLVFFAAFEVLKYFRYRPRPKPTS